MKRLILKTYGFLFWWGLISLLAAGGVWFFYPAYRELIGYYFYMVPGNSFLAFPHEPVVIYIGKRFGVLITILVALPPTVIACYLDYAVLTPLFQRTRLGRFQETKLYRRTLHYFQKAPFLTNAIFALSPLPFYPVRILSIASGYSRWRYSLAITLGRIPRYYFLVVSGKMLNIPDWMLFAFLALIILITLINRWRRRRTPVLQPTSVVDLELSEQRSSLAKEQVLP